MRETLSLPLGESDKFGLKVNEAVDEEWVSHHSDERSTEGEGNFSWDVIVVESPEHFEERDIALVHSLIEPPFFVVERVFWVTDEGEMTVKDEREGRMRHEQDLRKKGGTPARTLKEE